MQPTTSHVASAPLSIEINQKVANNEAQAEEAIEPCCSKNCLPGLALVTLGLSSLIVAREVYDAQNNDITAEYADLVAHNQTAVATELARVAFDKIRHQFEASIIASAFGAITSALPLVYVTNVRDHYPDSLFVRFFRVATIALGTGTIVTGGLAIGAGGTAAGTIAVTVGALGLALGIPSPAKLNSLITKTNQCFSSVFSRLCGC